MTGRIHHHPTDDSLARFAAGTLESGPALVIAAHLESCPECRAQVGKFEAVGGVLLNELAPVPMARDALELALARLDSPENSRPFPQRKAVDAAERLDGLVLPRALTGCDIGPWRWGGPGFRWSNVTLPHDKTANIMLMRIATGRKMPDHGHTGSEFTLVLKGSFSDKDGRYFSGDLSEVDAETEHQPIVDQEGECICLAAVEGSLRLRGFFGRFLNPFMG
jgi:putative transcriptional regulator